ncbi:periplasmatic protein [Proteus phage MidiMira-UFV02]|nr:periplasmatic protein [Proteus phage BigMira-UFV01]WJJ57737.1 periplasmatic protein [Proteus phage MidiMira-UFV02]
MTNQALTLRDEIRNEVNALLDNIGASYLRIGELLNEARSDFDNQREFLVWVEDEFSIKKSQCFNLMKVSLHFKDNESFQKVSMRVLLALIPYMDDNDIMRRAEVLALRGDLTTNSLNIILGKPETKVKETQAEPEKTQEKPAQLQSVPQEEVKEENKIPFEPDAEEKVSEPKAQPIESQENADNTAMKALLEQIKTLTEQNRELQERIISLSSVRETKKATAPMLPQFKSSCMYARLGLSAEEATKKTAVNKAKRELVKLGYGEGHEAWDFIKEAVEDLLK